MSESSSSCSIRTIISCLPSTTWLTEQSLQPRGAPSLWLPTAPLRWPTTLWPEPVFLRCLPAYRSPRHSWPTHTLDVPSSRPAPGQSRIVATQPSQRDPSNTQPQFVPLPEPPECKHQLSEQTPIHQPSRSSQQRPYPSSPGPPSAGEDVEIETFGVEIEERLVELGFEEEEMGCCLWGEVKWGDGEWKGYVLGGCRLFRRVIGISLKEYYGNV